MAMELIGGDGLYDYWGKVLNTIEALHLSYGTTIPEDVDAILDQTKLIQDVEYEAIAAAIPTYLSGWQSSSDSFVNSLAATMNSMLTQFVTEDKIDPPVSTTAALQELFKQMEDGGYYVEPNVTTATVTDGQENYGDVVLASTTIDGRGLTIQNAYDEQIDVTVGTDNATNLTTNSQLNPVGSLTPDWPTTSGISNGAVAITTTATDVLKSGDFNKTTVANAPDGWILQVGAAGTDVFVTDPAIYSLKVSGTPTGGTYLIYWRDAHDVLQVTTPLPYNASNGTVTNALRKIKGLESVTVSTSGTSPNLTHSVTMTGTRGDDDSIYAESGLTGGSPRIDVDVVRYGDPGTYLNRALRLACDGSTLHDMYLPVTLTEDTTYGVHFAVVVEDNPPEFSSSSSSSSLTSSSSSSLTSSASSASSESSQSESSSDSGSSSSVTSSSSSSTSQQSASSESSSDSSSSVTSSSSSSLTSSSGSSASSESDQSSSSSQSASSLSGSMSASSTSESSVTSSSSSSQYATELRVEVVDGIGGNPVVDYSGNEAVVKVDLDAATEQTRITGWFRTVKYPRQLYLRIHLTESPIAGKNVYIDDLMLRQATSLYQGGPLVAAYSGRTKPLSTDTYEIDVTNDRAGEWSTWLERVFGLNSLDLAVPTTGTILINDNLIG